MVGVRFRITVVLLAGALGFAACSETGIESPGATLPSVSLPLLSGDKGEPLSTCQTDKCLTVVVAPWCPVCHGVTPNIVALRLFLGSRVTSRVVVGLSPDLPAIKTYAAEFGPDAQLDADRALSPSGVPVFIVSDRRGKVLKVVSGFPPDAETSGSLAAALDLL